MTLVELVKVLLRTPLEVPIDVVLSDSGKTLTPDSIATFNNRPVVQLVIVLQADA